MWYSLNGRDFPWRREAAGSYLKVISEVLLQQTPAQRVADFLPGFLDRFPGWTELASPTEDDLGEYLKPLGLWRRRAHALAELAAVMVTLDGRFPATRDELESLPAVGQYVASAVLLFELGQPEPLLDLNMARLLERYFGPRVLADIRHDPQLQALAREVVAPSAQALNWAVLDFAALVCKARSPRCTQCALLRDCRFGMAHLRPAASVPTE